MDMVAGKDIEALNKKLEPYGMVYQGDVMQIPASTSDLEAKEIYSIITNYGLKYAGLSIFNSHNETYGAEYV